MNDLNPLPLRQLGRYSITRELRRERNSVVYLGLDPVMHREVVIKAVQLPPPADATAHFDAQIDPLEQAFVRQAQAAGKLSHPHIVTVFEAGRVRDIGYLAIERVNGRPLHDLIASGWRPQFVHCASIAARIADAIEHAHQQGVAHGQLGPQHVVLQIDGVPKVEGFGGWIDGGAAGDEALRRTESLLPYFHNELSDEARRRDVRAVIALIYMMLTGKAPGEKAASIALLRTDTPLPLARLVDDVLAANGSLRRSAADLRDALTAFIWNERKDNVAPATIGIPLAAPPRRDDAAPEAPTAPARPPSNRLPRPDTLAPTVAMTFDELREATAPLAANGSSAAPAVAAAAAAAPAAATQPGRGDRPLTLTIRATTLPPVVGAAVAPLPPLPPAPPPPIAHQVQAGLRQLGPWMRENRLLVGAVGGLAAVAVAIAAILAATAGPPATPTAEAPPALVVTGAPAGEGVLRLDIAPWGEVFVDAKPIGVSPPLQELKLPAGRHTVEIRYGDRAAVSAQIDVDPAKPLQIKHRFE